MAREFDCQWIITNEDAQDADSMGRLALFRAKSRQTAETKFRRTIERELLTSRTVLVAAAEGVTRRRAPAR